MPSDGPIAPFSLSIKDLPWQIAWDKDKCTLCGRCTAVARSMRLNWGFSASARWCPAVAARGAPSMNTVVYYGIRQRTDPAYACIGCAMCNMVCPNDAIIPMHGDESTSCAMHINRGGQPRRAGGGATIRRPAGHDQVYPDFHADGSGPGCRPARIRTAHAFGAGAAAGAKPQIHGGKRVDTAGSGDLPAHDRRHVLRGAFPQHVGRASDGGGLPQRGTQHAGAHLHRRRRLPAAPAAKSRFLKYVILQIASGYFGWDEIIHALPEMKEDPCAIEIKYGQGAKPGDGGLLMWYKVNQLDRRHPRCAPGGQPAQPADPPDPVFHRGIRGQNDPVHVHGLGLPGAGLPQNFGHIDGPGGTEQPDAQPLCRRPGHRRRGRRHRGGLQCVHESHGPPHRQQYPRCLPQSGEDRHAERDSPISPGAASAKPATWPPMPPP
jgi:ferredoxin